MKHQNRLAESKNDLRDTLQFFQKGFDFASRGLGQLAVHLLGGFENGLDLGQGFLRLNKRFLHSTEFFVGEVFGEAGSSTADA